jgi:eukaryotic-like serine/threonine-protein kinase
MSRERRDLISEVYHDALALAPEQRAAFLTEACSGDDALRREVESLLAFESASSPFLELPAAGVATVTTSVTSMIDRQLGPYRIVGLLGAGGMGEVYKALDTRLDRVVAVKVAGKRFSERFDREARAVALLNHPNICQLYDVGPDYLVMEFVEGTRVAPVDNVRRLMDVAVQIADGMAAAHAAGIVHRDLKPDNILVTHDGRAKILDFGLAKAAHEWVGEADPTRSAHGHDELTRPGTIVGTVAYMSPEQARGSPKLTPQSDQFSFGLVLFELATGRRAFHRDSAAGTMSAIIHDDAPPMPESFPAPLRWIVERLLSKDPAERYESSRDLYRELRQLRDRLSEATRARSVVDAKPVNRIRRLLWPAVAVTTIAAGMLAASWLGRAPTDETSTFRFSPLTTEQGSEQAPEFSPDGKSIVYVARVRGISQAFVKAVGSTDSVQITRATEDVAEPFWSRDGSTIYFRSASSLWAVAVSGGASRRVMDDLSAASILPDESTVVFVRSGRLWIGQSGGKPHAFGEPPFPASPNVTFVRVSPDGSRVAVIEGPDLWLLSYPKGEARKLGTGYSLYSWWSWYSDSRYALVTNRLDAHNFQISVCDSATGSSRVVYASAIHTLHASPSPDGRRIAYSAGEPNWKVEEVEVASGRLSTLVSTTSSAWQPDWNPSGSHFIFASAGEGQFAIQEWSRTDGPKRRLREEAGVLHLSTPRWTPDGTRFAYEKYSAGGGKLWVSNASGGQAEPVDPESIAYQLVAWSPDSQWLVYVRQVAGKMELAKIRPGSREPAVILTAGLTNAFSQSLAWSPKNDWILYPGGDGLWLIAPDGTGAHKLTSRQSAAVGFSKDGRRVVGVFHNPSDQGTPWQLWSIDVNTGAESLLAPLDWPASIDNVLGFSLHPDGTRFLTSTIVSYSDIWMLDGLNPPSPSLLGR